VRWAPGVGVKNSEFIGRWDVDVGVAFIPWEKLPSALDSITEGSIVDEGSLPEDFTHGEQYACSVFAYIPGTHFSSSLFGLMLFPLCS